MKYNKIDLNKLIPSKRRDLRKHVVDEIKESIQKNGFDPARPLTIIEQDEKYQIADGDHRKKAAEELGLTDIDCVIREGNIYQLGIQGNEIQGTYAPDDLFDKLSTIQKIRDGNEKITQKQVGEILRVSREVVSYYDSINNNIVTKVLETCKTYQGGRVTQDVTTVTFNFTERWFRDSGLYALYRKTEINEENKQINERYNEQTEYWQKRYINEFVEDKYNWGSQKKKKISDKFFMYQDMEIIAETDLLDKDNIPILIDAIRNQQFSTINQLKKRIIELNVKAKNILKQGDCLQILKEIQEQNEKIKNKKIEGGGVERYIDFVITDPPYGIEYQSNRSKYKNHITKEKVQNDNENWEELLENMLKAVYPLMKENSSIFIFTGWQNYSKAEAIVQKYFTQKNMCVWDKGNHGAGDLECSFGNRHEPFIHAMKGKRPLKKRIDDIFFENKLSSDKLKHPTQKPKNLINQILEGIAYKDDIVCDPFMGSGSHIKAAEEYGCKYIGIELNKKYFEQAKYWIEND